MASKIRDRIIDHAICCFAAHGYSGCSTKEISARADVTEGSLFRLFGSKDKLFEEALARVRSAMLSPADFERLLNSGSLESGIQRALRTMYNKLSVNGLRLISFAMLEDADRARALITAGYDARIRAIAKRIRQAVRDGKARKNVDPIIAATAIYSCARNLHFDSLIRRRSKKEQLVLVERVIRFWLRDVLK